MKQKKSFQKKGFNVFPEMLAATAEVCSEMPAIRYHNEMMTYQKLKDKVDILSESLISLGVQKGEKIVILLPNCPEFVVSFFAVAAIGGIAVPLNVRYKEDELCSYFRKCQASVVIVDGQACPLLDKITSVLEEKPILLLRGKGGERSDRTGDSVFFFEDLSPQAGYRDQRRLEPHDEVLHQYTTGSTGVAKGVVRTHRHLLAEAKNFTETVGLKESDTILCVAPLFHAHGFGNGMLAAVMSGACMVIEEAFIPREMLAIIGEQNISVFPGVPFMFKMLADTYLKKTVTFPALRLCFSAGAFLPSEVSRKFYKRYGVYIRQLYGSTEMGSVAINLSDDIEASLGSVGLPMANVVVDIFDENGNKLGANQVGEVGIKSPAATRGYDGLEAVSKEVFRDGYWYSGDLGKKDDQGRLYLTGRNKLFINVAGNKVDPVEVEVAIASYDKVEEVVVVGVEDPACGEMVKAVIVTNSHCEAREILRYCQGKLADYKVPRCIEFCREIPKSPLGKVLRKYLQ